MPRAPQERAAWEEEKTTAFSEVTRRPSDAVGRERRLTIEGLCVRGAAGRPGMGPDTGMAQHPAAGQPRAPERMERPLDVRVSPGPDRKGPGHSPWPA